MSKEAFAKLVCVVPLEAVARLKGHADVEILLDAAFSKGFAVEDT